MHHVNGFNLHTNFITIKYNVALSSICVEALGR